MWAGFSSAAWLLLVPGVGGVGVWPGLLKQKVAGSNPVATNPERGALRSQLSWVYAISSGRLSRMIGKPWLRVKWGGSLPKDLESCKGILQLSCKTLVKYQKSFQRYVDLQKTHLEKVFVACSPSPQFCCWALGTLQMVLILIHV